MKNREKRIRDVLEQYNSYLGTVSTIEGEKQEYKKLWEEAQKALFKIANTVNFRW